MVTEKIESDSLFSLIIGPMIWVVHFLTVYLTTAIACAKDFFDLKILGFGIVPLIVALATLIAAGLILDGAMVALRRWRGSRWEEAPPPPHDQANKQSRRRFLAYAGLLLCGLSLIATLWEALPVLFMTSCR